MLRECQRHAKTSFAHGVRDAIIIIITLLLILFSGILQFPFVSALTLMQASAVQQEAASYVQCVLEIV